jgi:hypothetical protein
MRRLGLHAVLVIVLTFALAGPTSANDGAVTVPSGPLYERCYDYPYRWQFEVAQGYNYYVYGEMVVSGPDGAAAATDDFLEFSAEGRDTFRYCGDRLGSYTVGATVTACNADLDCYTFDADATSFRFRLPLSTTALRASRTEVQKGDRVRLVARVFVQRPGGFRLTDRGYVRLERRTGRADWARVPGSRAALRGGMHRWHVTYRGGRVKYRAVTLRSHGHAGSTSRVTTLR